MKLNSKSIGIKLWGYFIIFAVIIFAVLWLLQTVFLQGFYNAMQIRHIKQTAEKIAENYGSNNAAEIFDGIASDNSLLILITDMQGNILYSTDEYSSSYNEYSRGQCHMRHRQANHNPYRSLPQHYSEFLQNLKNSDTNNVCYQIKNGSNNGATLVYGQILPSNQGVLYINTSLGAVGSTVSILRLQLCIVTFLALLMGFLISFFISKRFSKPIKLLSEKADCMAKGNFDITFDKGFCSELDELAEALNITAQELSVNNKLKNDLLANVSHDLRTPLTMIKGYAELIRDFSNEDKDAEKQDLDVIIRETDRLSLLVNDILDYSKLQAGNVQFEFKHINISTLAEDVIDSFSVLVKTENIIIQKNITPEEYVIADLHRIEQVLYNLISNAAAHIGEDKTVYISVTDKQNYVRIEVRDNGIGIDKNDLPHIWDRYFTNKDRSSNGMGLGLSIVKEILTRHNAAFGVQSEKGYGSLFWFELRKE